MKLTRFVYAVIMVVLVLLIYVRQRVELLKAGYEVRAKEMACLELLDQNKILDYNVYVLKSPSSLERFLKATNKNYKVASREKIVQLRMPGEETQPVAWSGGQILSNLFNLKSQAEATTINK